MDKRYQATLSPPLDLVRSWARAVSFGMQLENICVNILARDDDGDDRIGQKAILLNLELGFITPPRRPW